ncbi:phage head-tail joining protein [Sphingomonas nostoxanthinifaciens]|uniref:phage head-tail joining protein n=1 Tax=Sphingomonas nostoxanthinifaciens TaxID=2872652 RepID=UPI001CC20F70|nr:hypothetical protein [Sphingomonas nostoxanthinifaciens]UAK24193.1 hypothetical protein K8P63_17980 [Sphingomonas nostoxanthinifaciens]UAK24356.1 hypothetical protein K8P63_18920 [Sphingomonas nostoxanthinifaciens]
MAYNQGDLDALSTAMLNGIQEVTYADGRKVRYQTLADMRALRNDMKAEIAAAAAKVTPALRTTIGRICRR